MATSADDPSSGRRQAVVPAGWAEFYQETHVPAAVRHGHTLRVTGHTGDRADGNFDHDVEQQIRQTFHNVGDTLAEAGIGWAQVMSMTTYHVGLRVQTEPLLRVAAEFLTDPFPAWTAVGVTELFEPDATIEIECVAVIPR